MVAPWSAFWERNAFAELPIVAGWLSNAFLRGAISGVGVITATAGLAELAGALRVRRGGRSEEEAGAR